MRPLKKGTVMFKHSTGHKALSLAAETSASITASAVIGALCPPAGVAMSLVYTLGSSILGGAVGEPAGRMWANRIADYVDGASTSIKDLKNN
jgi:hypothetical protein|uniref:Uncharacterized protein n=1 Tax=Siphoviridae sp. ctTPJ4 TaxID=2825519 RepID=A0A8S5V0D3_9CAUD|nr:MAG TPA: hypothetical protein [Siphoviridae sp. ctTPJ4]